MHIKIEPMLAEVGSEKDLDNPNMAAELKAIARQQRCHQAFSVLLLPIEQTAHVFGL